MLTRSVVADWTDLEDLATGGDLDSVTDDGDLNLTADVRSSDSIARASEADVARRVDLASDALADCGLARSRPLLLDLPSERLGFFGGSMALRVGGDEHATMVDRHEPVSDGDLDGLTSEPHPDRVELAGETDLAGPASTG